MDASVGAPHCPICNEAFEKYFDQDREEWMFRNAMKVEERVSVMTEVLEANLSAYRRAGY